MEDFVIVSTEEEYYIGDDVTIVLTNNLEKTIRIPSLCPSHPLLLEQYKNGQWNTLSTESGISLECEGDDLKNSNAYTYQPKEISLEAKSDREISYSPWKYELFDQVGKYKASLVIGENDDRQTFMTEFQMIERGFWSSLYHYILYRPIFNLMVFLASIMPGYNFGLAVIALTLIIRFVLLLPNQKALKSQKAMMEIQPQLEEVRKKYKGDQQRISQETMLIWQKNKVSPVGGCLPMLIQIPIMITLFYTVRAGFTPYESHALYGFLQSFDLGLVDQNFYGILNLKEVNATWLPIIVGLSQFVQMKLSFSRRKKATAKKDIVDIDEKGKVLESKKDDKKSTDPDPMKMMNKTMIYFMPIMIAVLAATLPAAVGIYLLISSLFGVAQQFFVNRTS